MFSPVRGLLPTLPHIPPLQQARLLWKLPLLTIAPDTWPQDQLQ